MSAADAARAALINTSRRFRRRPNAKIAQLVTLSGRSELPIRLHPSRLYQLGEPGKWAVMTCPCGRGHTIELNLAHPGRARWFIEADDNRLVSLRPSVDVRADRRCHFWLRHGRVHWV